MKYVCYRHYKGATISGGRCNIHYGDCLESVGDELRYCGKTICLVNSKVGHEHFTCDDDGQGLTRGKLIYTIAYKARHMLHSDGHYYRLSEDEIKTLIEKYHRYLKNEAPILFNNEFYIASTNELRNIATSINIKP